MWKKYAAVTSTVMARKAGLKMSETERLRTASDTTGSAATVEWPSRLSVLLIFASAPCGCLRESQCTDSGTKKNTSGMNTSVTTEPNSNT